MDVPHIPVLQAEVLTALTLQPNQSIIDCTIGAGGHAEAILTQIGPAGRLLGLDQDPTALELAGKRLQPFQNQLHLANANFDQLAQQLVAPPFSSQQPFTPVHGILADLGVSSMQLDQPERGFSFQQDGPLDMRLGPDVPASAADLINNLEEKQLADLIYQYGEERQSRRIARAIVQNRPLRTTQGLAETVSKAVGGRRGRKIHPATRTFQAIRIAVNDELGALERFLPQALNSLTLGGRLVIISFHSLEDRLVKQFFRQEAGLKNTVEKPMPLLPEQEKKARIKIITKKPIVATEAESIANPRARSAKLRAAEVIS